LFLINIHDFPKMILKINLNGNYDTSLIVSNLNHNVFENDINMIKKKS